MHRKRCRTDPGAHEAARARELIRELSRDYSISAICEVMGINRSLYYYQPIKKASDHELTAKIKDIFKSSRENYGTRKIKYELAQLGYQVSRRRIGRIMRANGLVSHYTKASYRHHSVTCNQAPSCNLLDRDFNRQQPLDIIVSDLTYVRLGESWCYVCLIIDLWNREIIGWEASRHKDAKLVKRALQSVPYRLDEVKVFHTDRGSEFDNQLIDEALSAFGINRSLSAKGCPYDNAVNEATNHILKTEFANHHKFWSLKQLNALLADYIFWYNHKRIHGSLNYQTPISLRLQASTSVLYPSPLIDCCKKC